MADYGKWLDNPGNDNAAVDGLVPVSGYIKAGRPPEEVAMMEKAAEYGAHAVFFEAGRNDRPAVAQAFIFISDGPEKDLEFAALHKRLWSWGGVPLLYRKTRGLVQLFRCAHKPDFVTAQGKIVCHPIRTLKLATEISSDPWWDATRLRNGTLWDDPATTKLLLSSHKAAHRKLFDAVKKLYQNLNAEEILSASLRRKLLILSLLIAYLEAREVLLPDYFAQFLPGATKFFQVLGNGQGLLDLLANLEERFNGNVFTLSNDDRQFLPGNSQQLERFATLVEARQEITGQLSFWELYSFKDLPVELISQIYQLFVEKPDEAVYTPPFLVRLMLDEILDEKRLDRLQQSDEVILDPSCGSGVFLVEAYKRLVLNWRRHNGWALPNDGLLKNLLAKVHGIDHESGAVELATFSLYLALCDALKPETIRASIKLFPPLLGQTIHQSCFFEAKEQSLIKENIGVVVGNPPFKSSLTTDGAKRSYARYQKEHGPLPDKQLAYLFLHEAMEMVADGGVLCLLQQYNFLYNQKSEGFRRTFIDRWDVREILDFISVRGLFQKGGADTKVIVVVAENATPPPGRKILHATFRRSGRADAEQGFDIDYYDLHWLTRQMALSNDSIWRANLLGGGRVLGFVDRLKAFPTIGKYAAEQKPKWDFGEGFIKGTGGGSASHITGKKILPSEALTLNRIDTSMITDVIETQFTSPRSELRFTPPMLLVREQMDIPHAVWTKHYLTYKHQIVGFAAPEQHTQKLSDLEQWLRTEANSLRAFVAGTSARLFTQKSTSILEADILALPYPESRNLDVSPNEQIIVDDIVDYYRDLIRLGEDSTAVKESGQEALPAFAEVFTRQINGIYSKNPLRVLEPQTWPGVICQPFMFGEGEVDWNGAEELSGKVNSLLQEQQGASLFVTRITRIYDGNFVFLVKPDRLRYWLRSIALRDADEMLYDLRMQGF